MVMDVIKMHRQHEDKKVVVSQRKKIVSRIMLAVKECDEQSIFSYLLITPVFKEKKEYTFGNIIKENNL